MIFRGGSFKGAVAPVRFFAVSANFYPNTLNFLVCNEFVPTKHNYMLICNEFAALKKITCNMFTEFAPVIQKFKIRHY